MEFLGIGSAYGFAKFAQLNVKWKKREGDISKKTLESETPQIRQMREDAARMRKSNMISTLDAKLKGGGELTSDELEYLKENSPELYKEAVDIIRERQAYKKALENCKTKEDVTRLNTNKINGALSTARAISGNANIPKLKRQQIMERIMKMVMGIQKEHVNFIKSPRYTELPREQEILDDKKKEKKKITVEDETIEATKQPELRFEDLTDELEKLLDSITKEEPNTAEGAESTEGTTGENGATKNSGEAPKSHSAAKKTVNTRATSATSKPVSTAQSHTPTGHSAPAPTAKIYTASGGVKAPSAPSVSPRARVSVKA